VANSEHVEILKKGAAVWNEWRAARADLIPDLHKADLRMFDLRGGFEEQKRLNLRAADLSGAIIENADLGWADLDGADLRDASFERSDLRFATIRAANLTTVDLYEAVLTETDLSDSVLTDAFVHHTVFLRTILKNASLRQAEFEDTIIAGVDLATCDLSDTKHGGPSSVDLGTLLSSKGRIPAEFLRGCGLKDWEIEAAKLYEPELAPSQLLDIQTRIFDLRAGSPIQIGSLFISYTHSDGPFVDALEAKLDEEGIRFWRDVHHATAGRLDRIVDRAMRLNPTVLLILSEHSVQSDWVEDEVDRARELEKKLQRDVLCPIALDDAWIRCQWSRKLRTQIKKYNILPFTNWEDTATMNRMFRRLVEGLSIFYWPHR